MRALAHPTRLDLLDLLRIREEATASECARALDSTPKTCSYHLRVLAASDLVEEVDAPSGDGRMRAWRRAIGDIEIAQGLRDESGQTVGRATLNVIAQRDLHLFLTYLDSIQAPGESRAPSQREQGRGWEEVMVAHSRTALMSPAQLHRWGNAVERLTREHIQRAAERPTSTQRPVRLSARGFPQLMDGSAADD